jgi:predicted metal-dependent phosphotriesterase family hydrolase
MHRHVIPELKDLGATEGDLRRLFVDNPRRFLTGDA